MTVLSYDEALNTWFVQRFGNQEITFTKYGRLLGGSRNFETTTYKIETTTYKIIDAIDTTKPVELKIDYDEGYQYSEYTMQDASVECTIKYYIREDLAREYEYYNRTIELYRNETMPIGDIIKEILLVSQGFELPVKTK